MTKNNQAKVAKMIDDYLKRDVHTLYTDTLVLSSQILGAIELDWEEIAKILENRNLVGGLKREEAAQAIASAKEKVVKIK